MSIASTLGAGADVGVVVPVGWVRVAVDNSVAFKSQAESAKPEDAMPAGLRKSRREYFVRHIL